MVESNKIEVTDYMSLLTQGHLGDLDQSGLVSDSQQLSEFQESKAFQSDNIDNNTTDLKRMNLAKCNWYELAGAVSAGLIFIALHYVPGKLKNTLYIAFIFIAFGSYIVYKIRYYGYKLIVYDWGLTLNNFNISFLWCTVVGLIGSIVMISYMLIFGTGLAFHYDLILMFIFYPFWGVIQQFLIQGMIAINLTKLNINYYLIICLTACSFTLVHWPDCLLMFATFCVGLTFTPIFLKYKCLYPLGIYHGWCGALFYWLVLNQDPMERF